MEQTNVYKKIYELQKRVKALKKDSKSYGYEYLSGDKLFEVVRPAMDELGLLLLPSIQKMEQTPVEYQAWDSKSQSLVTKKENMCILDIDFTWVDVESGESLVQSWRGTGQNGFDKSFGSALTYAERYYLLKVFHIATNRDDVDAIAADRDKAVEQAAQKIAGTPVAGTAAPVFPDVAAMKNDAQYWKWVKAEGEGKRTKQTNKSTRQAFIERFRPNKEQLEAFDFDVREYKEVLAQASDNK